MPHTTEILTFQDCDLEKHANDLWSHLLTKLPEVIKPRNGLLEHVPEVPGIHSWYYYVKPSRSIFGGMECFLLALND